MWTSTNFVESITERDIDLLILEELVCSQDFRVWFLRSVLGVDDGTAFLGALHSVSNELGESDLVIGFKKLDGHEFAVLVENKVCANFQPDQAERYHKRGAKGVDAGHWGSFVTCVIAPKSYLAAESGAEEFHHSCAYETLEEWFLSRSDGSERARFKATLLRYAIDKSRRKLPPVISPEVTAFWLAYWEMLNAKFPALQLDKPGAKGPLADWPSIRSDQLPARTSILHKWAQGFVDLQINGAAALAEKFTHAATPLLPPDISIEITGKSLALSIVVPPLNRWRPFDAQTEQAGKGLTAATRLAEIGSRAIKESGLFNGIARA
jgi:hypothetical protein